jgi:hypothetical protein
MLKSGQGNGPKTCSKRWSLKDFKVFFGQSLEPKTSWYFGFALVLKKTQDPNPNLDSKTQKTQGPDPNIKFFRFR